MKTIRKKVIGLETLLKWIFTLIPIGLIVLILGGRLEQQYYRRIQEIDVHAVWLKNQSVRYPAETVKNLLLSQLGVYWYRVAEPVEHSLVLKSSDGARWYFVLNKKAVFNELIEKERPLLILGLVGLLASVEIAVFLAYALVRPLKRLCWACTEIAQGRRVELMPAAWLPREFRELTVSFNKMSQQLERWKDVQRQVEWMDRLACIGEMASGLSHEIRNPLASMRVRVELLKRQQHSEQVATDIEVLDTELQRLNKVVGDLLSFVRPNANVRIGVPLSEILLWCSDMLRLQCQRQGVQWIHENEGFKCPPVQVDKGQIQQAVLNLALNALQVMPKGGIIYSRIESIEDFSVLIIGDTGPGIAREAQDHIFTPFYTTRKEGTGLGLFIVQRIVDSHRGKIAFTSSPDGTEFRILLPLNG